MPLGFSPLLWDVDPAGIDVEADEAFLIGRILSAGTLESIRWARRRFGDDAIREWIVRHEGRQLSEPQIRFWETVIGLPAERVARVARRTRTADLGARGRLMIHPEVRPARISPP